MRMERRRRQVEMVPEPESAAPRDILPTIIGLLRIWIGQYWTPRPFRCFVWHVILIGEEQSQDGRLAEHGHQYIRYCRVGTQPRSGALGNIDATTWDIAGEVPGPVVNLGQVGKKSYVSSSDKSLVRKYLVYCRGGTQPRSRPRGGGGPAGPR